MTIPKLASVMLALIVSAIASTELQAKTTEMPAFDRHDVRGYVSTAALEIAAPHRVKHHRHRRHEERPRVPVNYAVAGMVTVPTAAGISVTVAPSFAPKITAFIADLVARGYHPSRITCYSLSKSHVQNSLHFRGKACDFNQRGWGKTDAPMYHVADLARAHGLRDGCTFRDCGHIDAGLRYAARQNRHRYASAN